MNKLTNTLKRKNNKKGFTLIELIVVIAILAILAAIAIPRLSGFQNDAKISSDKATLATLNSAIAIGVADGTIKGNIVATAANSTGIITLQEGTTDRNNLLESGAAFKLDDNQNKTFTWTISNGEITGAPTIADDGKITGTAITTP